MMRCLQLAALGNGFVAPNPLVGAVLVHHDRIIGEGWHRQYGQAHAEVNCFDSVKEEDKPLIPESTLFVSLEPCAHFGKTPPCANRIVAEGVRKVVIGTTDPFEAVKGKGIGILKDADTEVITGLLEAECRWQNRRFFTFHEKKRPYVHLKWAATADGFMAAGSGNRLLISSAVTNRLVHRWRSEEAAILVGTGTALADNPQLSARYGWTHQPVRVLIDMKGIVPHLYHLFSDGKPLIVLNGERNGQEGPVTWIRVDDSRPQTYLQALYAQGIQSVLIEGGAALLRSFLQQNCWDEAHIITSMRLRAGKGLPMPDKPSGMCKDRWMMGDDQIEFFVND